MVHLQYFPLLPSFSTISLSKTFIASASLDNELYCVNGFRSDCFIYSFLMCSYILIIIILRFIKLILICIFISYYFVLIGFHLSVQCPKASILKYSTWCDVKCGKYCGFNYFARKCRYFEWLLLGHCIPKFVQEQIELLFALKFFHIIEMPRRILACNFSYLKLFQGFNIVFQFLFEE